MECSHEDMVYLVKNMCFFTKKKFEMIKKEEIKQYTSS